MSFLFPKPKAPAQTPPVKLANMNVTEANNGAAVTIVMGQRRVAQKLIYYADFTAIPHVQQNATTGGKGGGGSSSSGSTITTYTYTATTMGALCSGPVAGLVNVWDTSGRFAQTSTSETITVPTGGGAHTVTNHGLFKVDQGVGVATAFSQAVNDFGSLGATTLSGTYQVPMKPVTGTPATGQYSVNPATGVYTFAAADAGKSVTINYSYNLLQINNLEDASIPGTPFQVLVQDSADFLQDNGVVFYPSNVALAKVASSPAAGQYTVSSGGLYTFNSGDTLKQIQISYVTQTQNQDSDAQTALSLTLLNGAQGQAPWSFLTSRHPDAAFGYTETAIIASSDMDLGETGAMPNYTFEVLGPYVYGGGTVDCDPADCIGALLADPFFGIQFPTANFGDWTQASNFWVANSFFISPLIDTQTTVASVIGQILEAGMTAAFWSEGKLKLAPYGDTSAAGNGKIFVPNTQPVVDLTDDDFIGDGLVKVQRTAWQDANNKVQISWTNRLNAYNSETTTESDLAAIQRYGLRTEDPQSWDFITTLAAAQFAGNLRVKRSVNIRAQYTFNVTSNYSYLEPMDLVTITVPEMGWDKLPVRLTKVINHPDENGLEITAEEFPWGTAQPTKYAKQTGAGFKPNAGQADPGNTTAIIFEAPNRLAMQQGNILYGFVNGTSPDWAGCQPYVSFDGTNYQPFGPPITAPARLGTLTSSLSPGSADPDTQTFTVQMADAQSILPQMSQVDFDADVSLCALVDSPYVLVNGDFESGSTLPPTGWNTLGLTVSYDTITQHSGSRSLKVSYTAQFQAVESVLNAVKPGETFQLSGWIKGDGVNFFEIQHAFLDGSGTYLGGGAQQAVTNASGWTFVQSTDTAPAGAVHGQLWLQSDSVGSTLCEFDDIRVSRVSDTLELLAYRDSTLVAPNTYRLGNLHRGLMGTSNQTHNTTETFARLDQASFTYQYDPSYYGKNIFFKFPSFNTAGGRSQPLSQAAVFTFPLSGNGPGAIDLNTGIYRPGQGNIQSISYPAAFTPSRTTSSIGFSWTGTLTRGTVPTPNVDPSLVSASSLSGSITCSGLSVGTNYWFYPYLDDLNGNTSVQFVTNGSSVTGAVGSPAIAFTSPNVGAASFQQRNDHVSLGTLATSTTTGGTGGGGGLGGSGSTCPRYDMVAYRRTNNGDREIVTMDAVRAGDWLWGRESGTDQWLRVKGVNSKIRNSWAAVSFTNGESVVVTPNHGWPTDHGITATYDLTLQHIFYIEDRGRTFLSGIQRLDEEALCIGLELDSVDHAYYIGSTIPSVLTQNGFVLPS